MFFNGVNIKTISFPTFSNYGILIFKKFGLLAAMNQNVS